MFQLISHNLWYEWYFGDLFRRDSLRYPVEFLSMLQQFQVSYVNKFVYMCASNA